MLRTRLTEKYELSAPFVSAGMSGNTTPALVAAVANAGALGLHGVADMPPGRMVDDIAAIRSATNGAFGVGIIPHMCNDEHINICIKAKVRVVNFFWDDVPEHWVSRLRDAGVHLWKQVGSVKEAEHYLRRGFDVLMVQGSEAGGHNRAEASGSALIPAVADIAGDVPIVASGGIADGRAAASALALGADGVCVGTRLLASNEAYTHPEYRRRLVEAKVGDTLRSNIFGLEWNNATSRHLRNRAASEWEHRDYPAPYASVAESELYEFGRQEFFGTEYVHRRFCMYPPNPTFVGDFEEVCLYAGESVGQTKSIKGAGEIVTEIMSDAENIIRGRLAGMVVANAAPARAAGSHGKRRKRHD